MECTEGKPTPDVQVAVESHYLQIMKKMIVKKCAPSAELMQDLMKSLQKLKLLESGQSWN